MEAILLGDDVSPLRVTGLARGEDWRSAAACQDTDPDVFFPLSGVGKSLEQVECAKAICASCPVRQDCLAFALRTDQAHGIWGGLTEEERRVYSLSSSAEQFLDLVQAVGKVGDVAAGDHRCGVPVEDVRGSGIGRAAPVSRRAGRAEPWRGSCSARLAESLQKKPRCPFRPCSCDAL